MTRDEVHLFRTPISRQRAKREAARSFPALKRVEERLSTLLQAQQRILEEGISWRGEHSRARCTLNSIIRIIRDERLIENTTLNRLDGIIGHFSMEEQPSRFRRRRNCRIDVKRKTKPRRSCPSLSGTRGFSRTRVNYFPRNLAAVIEPSLDPVDFSSNSRFTISLQSRRDFNKASASRSRDLEIDTEQSRLANSLDPCMLSLLRSRKSRCR